MKYILLSSETDAKPESFVQLCGVFETLDAANDAAKMLLCKVSGSFSVNYDQDGCLVMAPEDYKTVKRGPAKKPSFKVSVAALDFAKLSAAAAAAADLTPATPPARAYPDNCPKKPVEPATTTETVTLYRFTLKHIRLDRCGEIDHKKVQKECLFASKIKALEFFYAESVKLGSGYDSDDDAIEDWIDEYIRDDDFPEYEREYNPYISDCLAIKEQKFEVVFRGDKQLKKGWVETKTNTFRVKDWDGTKQKYDQAKEMDSSRRQDVVERAF